MRLRFASLCFHFCCIVSLILVLSLFFSLVSLLLSYLLICKSKTLLCPGSLSHPCPHTLSIHYPPIYPSVPSSAPPLLVITSPTQANRRRHSLSRTLVLLLQVYNYIVSNSTEQHCSSQDPHELRPLLRYCESRLAQA
jgi:hypothetical protein